MREVGMAAEAREPAGKNVNCWLVELRTRLDLGAAAVMWSRGDVAGVVAVEAVVGTLPTT